MNKNISEILSNYTSKNINNNYYYRNSRILNSVKNSQAHSINRTNSMELNDYNHSYKDYRINGQNYFKHNDLNNIKKFLNKSQKDNLIYLVTNSGNVYKIYKREDLSKNNFLNGINLDFISTQRQNEIINIREKIKKDIDSDYYSRKLNL